MTKYVEEYSDVNVEGIDYFVKEEFDNYLYKDSECTIKVNSAEMVHAFEMGDIMINDGIYKSRPMCLGKDEESTFVIYNKVVTSVDEQTEEETMEVVPTQVLAYDEPEETEEVEAGE